MQEYPVQQVLELACAAQRINNDYVKYPEAKHDSEGKFLYMIQSNKSLIEITLDHRLWRGDPKDAPMPLRVGPEDVARAEEIKKYYRKLIFAAVEGENEFLIEVNSILSGETVPNNKFGYVACLPSVQLKDAQRSLVTKAVRSVDNGYLGQPGDNLFDLDCEILEVIKSKNFDAWNIGAIINNKLVSWMSQKELAVGPCVIVKAKIKDTRKHWKHQTDETRINYVKAMQ